LCFGVSVPAQKVGAAAWERLQTRLAEVNRDIRTRGIRSVHEITGGLAGVGSDLLTGYSYWRSSSTGS